MFKLCYLYEGSVIRTTVQFYKSTSFCKGKSLHHTAAPIRESNLLYLKEMSNRNLTESSGAEYDTCVEICVLKNFEYSFVSHFPTGFYRASHVVCLTYNIIQTVLIIVLNYLAIHAFYKSSQLRRKTTLFLVMILSANDLIIGLVVEPLFLVHLGRAIFGKEDCFVFMLNVVTQTVILPFSMITFLVLNFEIYLSVIHPIFYKTKVTNTRIFYLLLILWSTFIIREYLFLFVLKKNTVAFILTLTIALAMIALVYMHGRIFLTVYQRRRIEASVHHHHHHGKAIARVVRDARSCIMVLLCTVCCYLPVSVEIGPRERTLITSIVLNPWSTTLLFSASILNSVIFYWQNKILRNQAKAILRALYSF